MSTRSASAWAPAPTAASVFTTAAATIRSPAREACVFPALMRQPNFTVITKGYVTRVNKAADGKTATGVTYIDEAGQ